MDGQFFIWFGFVLFMSALVYIDLSFHPKDRQTPKGTSIALSCLWISMAFGFCLGLSYVSGWDKGLAFLTGYLIEESLSLDNLFVFILIFSYFKTPEQYQHKVLFWGVAGAAIMRGLFILGGTALVGQFRWILYLFGAFLLYMAVKVIQNKNKKMHPENTPLLRIMQKFIPITPQYVEDRFFIKLQGKVFATLLFAALLTIEISDMLFALDSIPAIFSITLDPFIVFSSNMFAVLGLRSLFFVLKNLMRLFYFIDYGVAGILFFTGLKMLLIPWAAISNEISLAVIASLLVLSMAPTLLKFN